MTQPTENRQIAPYPQALADLVAATAYRPNWTVKLQDLDRGQGSAGLTLIITTCGYDSYHPERGETYRVMHYMPVPPAAYDERAWLRWLFDQFATVELHECMEFFAIGDGRPFAPNHGPGRNPYSVLELGADVDVRTSFRGIVREPSQ